MLERKVAELTRKNHGFNERHLQDKQTITILRMAAANTKTPESEHMLITQQRKIAELTQQNDQLIKQLASRHTTTC